MDLEPIWKNFMNQLILNKLIHSSNWKKITGIPFLYITIYPNLSQKSLEEEIKKCSSFVIKGKRLHFDTVFVRKDGPLFVYRHRFYVPQEKMFCCGNLCVDCTRLIK